MLERSDQTTKIFIFFAIAILFFFSSGKLNAQVNTSPDAVAFRVIPNPEHSSPLTWYKENIRSDNRGNPQSLLVDGYEAVRDGRTVYVNAANIEGARLFTNIYVISYNQSSEDATVDIFGQILSRWKFNTNLNTPGNCVSELVACQNDDQCSEDFTCNLASHLCEMQCLTDDQCHTDSYCQSDKAKVVRDTRRLSDLREIKLALRAYFEINDHYPSLSAGTYLPNRTISVWPSWKENLSKELGIVLPVDPINKLGQCTENTVDRDGSSYDAIANNTCTGIVGTGASSCSYDKWSYIINIPKGGDYKAYIDTTNNNSSIYGDLNSYIPPSQSPREDICTLDGVQHHINIYVDNKYKGYVCNQAVGPDKPLQRGIVSLGTLQAGNHTISYEWDNDWAYDPDNTWGSGDEADSNILVHKVGLISSSYDPVTCWDEVSKKFADPFPSNNVFEMPANSNVYVYTSRYDGATYSVCGIMNSVYITEGQGACAGSGSNIGNTGDIGNRAPVVSCGALVARQGKELKGTINAYDPDNNRITWSSLNTSLSSWTGWSSAPQMSAGATFYEKIIHANIAGDPGTYQVAVTVTDDRTPPGSTYKVCDIKVYPDGIPVIKPLSCPTSVRVGDTYDPCTVSMLEPGTYTFSITGLPPGFTYDPTTGTITGIPNTGGSYTITIIATNAQGKSSNPYIYNLKIVTYCGDNTKQKPNLEGTGGPANDGNEDCDGTSGIATSPADSNSGKWYACTANCVFTGGYCQDGKKDAAYGEECDKTDGVGIGQICTADCKLQAIPYCGDHMLNQPSEQCEDTSTTPCTTASGYNGIKTCNPATCLYGSCVATESCGDGIKNGPEECEGTVGGSGTGPTDQWECDPATCKTTGGYCMDAKVDSPYEDCQAPGGGTSQDDQWECNNCKWAGGFCGNGKKNIPYEECDPPELGSGTGPTDQYECDSATCKSKGGFCGNVSVEVAHGEQCDKTDFNGKTCVDYGFGAGILACNGLCKADTSGCCTAVNTALKFGGGVTSIGLKTGQTNTLELPACLSITPGSAKLTAVTGLSPEPTAIMFVTDTSDSMLSTLPDVQSGLITAIDKLHQSTASGAIVSVGLVAFEFFTHITPIVDLSMDFNRDLLVAQINSYVAQGTTRTAQGIGDAAATLNSYKDSTGYSKLIQILLTDSMPDDPATTKFMSNLAKYTTGYEQEIYTVAYMDPNPLLDNQRSDICRYSSDCGPELTGCTGTCYVNNFSWTGAGTQVTMLYDNIVNRVMGSGISSNINISLNGNITTFNFGAASTKDVTLNLGSIACAASPQSLALTVSFTGSQTLTLKNPTINICAP